MAITTITLPMPNGRCEAPSSRAGTDNVREKVREQIKYGADWVKISALRLVA